MPEIELPQGFQPTSPDGTTVLTIGAKHAGNNGTLEFATRQWPRVIERIPQVGPKLKRHPLDLDILPPNGLV